MDSTACQCHRRAREAPARGAGGTVGGGGGSDRGSSSLSQGVFPHAILFTPYTCFSWPDGLHTGRPQGTTRPLEDEGSMSRSLVKSTSLASLRSAFSLSGKTSIDTSPSTSHHTSFRLSAEAMTTQGIPASILTETSIPRNRVGGTVKPLPPRPKGDGDLTASQTCIKRKVVPARTAESNASSPATLRDADQSRSRPVMYSGHRVEPYLRLNQRFTGPVCTSRAQV